MPRASGAYSNSLRKRCSLACKVVCASVRVCSAACSMLRTFAISTISMALASDTGDWVSVASDVTSLRLASKAPMTLNRVTPSRISPSRMLASNMGAPYISCGMVTTTFQGAMPVGATNRLSSSPPVAVSIFGVPPRAMVSFVLSNNFNRQPAGNANCLMRCAYWRASNVVSIR